MIRDSDHSAALQQQVLQALQDHIPLNIQGGGSKHFLGRKTTGTPLQIGAHRGIIQYDPRELVITARAGTPLQEIEDTLSRSAQMLAFEPPHYGAHATLGGTIACGLSGARRPYAGSARDFTLGCRILNGRGEILSFGGQVMKNVAGYDLSRLMVGAFGTLGVLLDISLKVLPQAASSLSITHECTPAEAIKKMSGYFSKAYPIDAACFHGELCTLRLTGSEQAVRHARAQLGGEILPDCATFWRDLNEQQLAMFTASQTLYRILVKPATPPLDIAGKWLLDWGGAQRWLASDEPLEQVRRQVAAVGGQVTQWRGADASGAIFSPLNSAQMALHQRLKHSLDPDEIFNRGRMYAEL